MQPIELIDFGDAGLPPVQMLCQRTGGVGSHKPARRLIDQFLLRIAQQRCETRVDIHKSRSVIGLDQALAHRLEQQIVVRVSDMQGAGWTSVEVHIRSIKIWVFGLLPVLAAKPDRLCAGGR